MYNDDMNKDLSELNANQTSTNSEVNTKTQIEVLQSISDKLATIAEVLRKVPDYNEDK